MVLQVYKYKPPHHACSVNGCELTGVRCVGCGKPVCGTHSRPTGQRPDPLKVRACQDCARETPSLVHYPTQLGTHQSAPEIVNRGTAGYWARKGLLDWLRNIKEKG